MNVRIAKSVLVAGILGLNFATHATPQQWELTPETQVGFEIKSMGLSIVKGKFEQIQSSMSFDPAAPLHASAQFVLDIKSLSLNKPSLSNLILGEDFFDAEKYQTATFTSHGFIVLGPHHYSITGDLSLRGVTRRVVLDTILKPSISQPQRLDVDATTVITRSDFGMKKAFGGIGEKVNIVVSGQWQLK